MSEQSRPIPFSLQPASQNDEPFLWDMLYAAIHVPPGAAPPARDVVQLPALAVAVRGWGRPHDYGLIARRAASGESLGAAWFRLYPEAERNYGFVDARTPVLAMAVREGFRGMGIGTALLAGLIEYASAHYPALSLSVSKTNPARRLYARLGFKVTGREEGDSFTMRLAL